MEITEKIEEQIKAVASSGATNMFDVTEVQRLAFENKFYELVDLLTVDQKAYVQFIMYGRRSGRGGARKGAGRPKLAVKRKHYNWYVTEEEREFLMEQLQNFREKNKI